MEQVYSQKYSIKLNNEDDYLFRICWDKSIKENEYYVQCICGTDCKCHQQSKISMKIAKQHWNASCRYNNNRQKKQETNQDQKNMKKFFNVVLKFTPFFKLNKL